MARIIRKSWLALGALIPCIAALSAAALPPPPVMKIPARPTPPLAFDQYGVSYGLIGPQAVVEAHFTFRNLGRQPVTIEEVEPSCGCLKWHLQGDRRTFRPGEPGCITVRLATANEQPGPHHYTLKVTTAGASPQTESLTFRVNLPEQKVTVDPSEVYFYQLNGDADSRTIYITDHRRDRPAPLQIRDVECRSRHLSVEILPSEQDADGLSRIPVRLNVAGDLPPGREITYLRLTTDDPEFRKLAVPVLVEGPAETAAELPDYGPPLPPGASLDQVWGILKKQQN